MKSITSKRSTMRVALSLCLISFALLSFPQQLVHAQNMSWSVKSGVDLPEGITLYEGFGTSALVRAWYAKASPKAAEEWTFQVHRSDVPSGMETVSEFVARTGAFLGVNAGYFGGAASLSLVISDGSIKSSNAGSLSRTSGTYYPTRAAFGMRADTTFEAAWVYTIGGATYSYASPSPNTQSTPAPQPVAADGTVWDVVEAIGGGPMLIKDGQTQITWEEEVFFGSGIGTVSDLQPRTAIGVTAEGDVLLLVVDGRQTLSQGVSLTQLASIMASLGAVHAINLDGGGSSTMVADGALINRPEGGTAQRSVTSAVLLAPKRTTDGGGGETGRQPSVFDTGDTCCYRETGVWFESANMPYHGNTPSRLTEADGSGDHAVFYFNDVDEGTYDLEVWFVASTNRGTNTPHTVYHGGQSITFRVDQTDPQTLDKWVPLGRVDIAPGDSLVISDDASGNASKNYVVADGVRLIPVSIVNSELHQDRTATWSVFPTLLSKGTPVSIVSSVREAQYHVVDVLGRAVGGGAIRDGRTAIETDALARGVYFVRMQANESVEVRSFVVN